MKEKNSFIRFIGISYFMLGLLRIFNLTKIEFKFLFSLSLAGFLFIILDCVSFLLEKKLNEERSRYLIYKLKNLILLLCAFSIVVLPFIPAIKWNNYFLKQVNDAIVFLGLGLVIILIDLKSEKESKKKTDTEIG